MTPAGRSCGSFRTQGGLPDSPWPSGFLDRPPTPCDGAYLDAENGIDCWWSTTFLGDLLGWIHEPASRPPTGCRPGALDADRAPA